MGRFLVVRDGRRVRLGETGVITVSLGRKRPQASL